MTLTYYGSTIIPFSSRDVSVDLEELRPAFEELCPDLYLLRITQVDFLKKHLPGNIVDQIDERTWSMYILGELNLKEYRNIEAGLSEADIKIFKEFLPSRYRGVSNFNLSATGDGWKMERIPAYTDGHRQAKVRDSENTDYNIYPRFFRELPEQCVNSSLKNLMKYGCKLARDYSGADHFNVRVQHMMILSEFGRAATNAPEGIHQDDSDYIVSAFVIERENITGAESRIYGPDKTTMLYKSTLEPGEGIFQPDRNTQLWHDVTPVTAIDRSRTGRRSIIGLDINILK